MVARDLDDTTPGSEVELAARARSRRRRAHIAYIASAAVLVVASAVAIGKVATTGTRRRAHPPVAGAFFRGGVPDYDAATERQLPELLAEVRASGDERARAHELSDRFAARGLGYYLRADGHEVHAYRVEHVVFVRVGGDPRRVLQVRRLDPGPAQHLLGMQADDLGDAVVLLDQIDAFVASHVSPTVAGAPYPIDARLAGAAGAAIRRELAGRDPAEITRLVTATVRRHEARHDFDDDLDPPLRMPADLAAIVGHKQNDPFVARARAELSAYLSQIANDPVTPQLALWNLASMGSHRGSAEAAVAEVVIYGLARIRGTTSAGLAKLSDDDLRGAARSLWQELYGEPCATMVDPW